MFGTTCIPSTLFILAFSFCTLAYKPNCDFKLIGHVENIFYNDIRLSSDTHACIKCFIAINTDHNSTRDKKYHSCSRVETCRFAEIAMLKNIKVEVWGKLYAGGNFNAVVGLHVSGKRATFYDF